MFSEEDIGIIEPYNYLAVSMMKKSNKIEDMKNYIEMKLSEEDNSYLVKLVNKLTFRHTRLGKLEKKLLDLKSRVNPYLKFVKSGFEDKNLFKYGGCVSKRGV